MPNRTTEELLNSIKTWKAKYDEELHYLPSSILENRANSLFDEISAKLRESEKHAEMMSKMATPSDALKAELTLCRASLNSQEGGLIMLVDKMQYDIEADAEQILCSDNEIADECRAWNTGAGHMIDIIAIVLEASNAVKELQRAQKTLIAVDDLKPRIKQETSSNGALLMEIGYTRGYNEAINNIRKAIESTTTDKEK